MAGALLVAFAAWALCALWSAPPAVAGGMLMVGGGPPGGAFMPLAEAIADSGSRLSSGLKLKAIASGGSEDNVRRLSRGELDFGLAYAADIYLASKGRLLGDSRVYDSVRPMGFLYGAPAQLVVPADSSVKSALDLAGKTVAVGNAGSGAALSAMRFFGHLGLRGKFRAVHLGYAAAARALARGDIDAFWVLVGFPAPAVTTAARQMRVRLVNVGLDAERSGFYRAFPFYSPITIAAGTYPGVDTPCRTFQDSTLLCCHQGLDQNLVYRLMAAIWSPGGLKTLRAVNRAAADTSLRTAFLGVPVPLACGADKFWCEHGFTIPRALKAP